MVVHKREPSVFSRLSPLSCIRTELSSMLMHVKRLSICMYKDAPGFLNSSQKKMSFRKNEFHEKEYKVYLEYSPKHAQ
jgi:hypothetical protein